ncbi:2-nitropropane dioxygenase [Aspergillus unguis]
MLTTEFTKTLQIQYPVVLAGMGQVAGAPLVSAVSNAGGLGVVGGALYTPDQLRAILADVKSLLKDPGLPFGVDLLIPQIGGSARKTNYDYTAGKLDELIDVVIESGAKLFVAAVGVPPRSVVDRLHAAGVLYMNIVGHPKHVHKACAAGADIICAQGGEAGGHTGDIPFSVLVPACADICRQYKSPMTGKPVMLIAGGGVSDGRSLAAGLMLGASAVWVGTRFVVAKESDAPRGAKESILQSGFDSTIRTLIFTGRPLRTLSTPYIADWEARRQDEIRALTQRGIIPIEHDHDRLEERGELTEEIESQSVKRPMGIVSGMIVKGDQPAREIILQMVRQAEGLLRSAGGYVAVGSHL